MAKIIEEIKAVGPFHYIELKEVEDGVENRRIITPDADVSSEDAQIQALASANWTDEIKASYAAKIAKEQAEDAKILEEYELRKQNSTETKVATLESTIAALEARLASLEG